MARVTVVAAHESRALHADTPRGAGSSDAHPWLCTSCNVRNEAGDRCENPQCALLRAHVGVSIGYDRRGSRMRPAGAVPVPAMQWAESKASAGKRRSLLSRPTPVTQVARVTQTHSSSEAAFHLLNLSDDLLAVILDMSTDCVALVRLSQTCKKMRKAAREDRLWRPILQGFFDGEMPPPSFADVHAAPALEVLRDQVEFARRLREREVGLRRFMIPACARLWRARPAQRLEESYEELAPGALAWEEAMYMRVDAEWEARRAEKKAAAEARGEEWTQSPIEAHMDRPDYRMETSVQCYGRFVKVSAGSVKLLRSGVPRAEASFTHWVRQEEIPQDVNELRFSSTCDYDYGLMCAFADEKLAQIADRLLGDASAERARLTRRSLVGHYTAADPGDEAQDNDQPLPWLLREWPQHERLQPLDCGAHVLPKLLCGFYGGYFCAENIPQSMGIGPYLALGCWYDGSTRYTSNWDLM